jgi:hypothetical protein
MNPPIYLLSNTPNMALFSSWLKTGFKPIDANISEF